MGNFICVTCGSQFTESVQAACLLRDLRDERLFIGPQRPEVGTLENLRARHHNSFR